MKRACLAATGMFVALLATAAFAATPTLETFDGGVNGFLRNTTSSVVVHAAAGGNPTGHLQSRRDDPAFPIGALTDRLEFTGNYAADGINRVSVDLNFLTGQFTDAWVRFRIDSVSNGWLHPLTAAFPANVWNNYSVNFDPTWTDLVARANGWITDFDVNPLADPSPAFATVLADVGTAEVRIASTGASTLVGIDNFQIVPEPSTIGLVIVGGLAMLLVRRRGR